MKKGDHPSIEKMGFQPGHKPYNDWSHVNERIRNDPELRARWLDAKKGRVAWNKGLSKDRYPNGIASGEDHGNWKGGHGGFRDTAEWERVRLQVLRRDGYTCQACGDRNHKGRGSRIALEVHHIVAVKHAPDRALCSDNLMTLCADCHRKTDNFGSKCLSEA